MDLTDIYTIKSILRENRIRPNKSFGQNFLVDKNVFEKIIETADLSNDDFVLEIGPGIGGLTNLLAQKAKLVLAIEKDYDLVTLLRKQFKSQNNIKIIHADILRYDLGQIKDRYKVVANLPYQITSPCIRKFLTEENKPKEMILMVQREVAQRICAKPGTRERGFLTVLVEFFADAQIIENVDRTCFWPVPGVDSAILKISSKYQVVSSKQIDPESFFRLVKAGFSQKRRQIHNPLKANLHLSKDRIFDILKKAGIRPEMRAEELSLKEWVKLYKIISL